MKRNSRMEEKKKTIQKKKKKVLTEKQIIGRKSKQKGVANENKTIKYLLNNYNWFQIASKDYVYHTPRGTRYHKDLFSVNYYEGNGEIKQAGFDIMAIAMDKIVYLVQVKSNKKPSKAYINALRNFAMPLNVVKMLHVWKDDGTLYQEIL